MSLVASYSRPIRRVPCAADDEGLIRSAVEDPEAFEVLFARHRDGLYGFLFRRLRRHEETEDALTLTFCNAWRARAGFRGAASGKAWLYQIATRVALDAVRRRLRHPEEELDAPEAERMAVLDEAPDPVALVLEREREARVREQVRAALDHLDKEERRLVRLFYFDGYNYEEISALLGVSRSQVRGRLHRLRQRLRRHLEPA